MGLIINENIKDSVTVFQLIGDLDTTTAGELEQRVKKVIASDSPSIIFDMGGLSYVSSFGIRVIVYTSKAMRAHKDRFAIHSIQKDVMEILTISGLNRLLTVVDNEESALAELSKTA